MDGSRQFARRAGFAAIRLAVAIAATAGITLLCFRLIPVNATTAGFGYLVEVLIIATVWGLREAVVTSLVAMLCFNYFFFEPVGTFTISDTHNWVALFAFLATSLIAGQLSAHAKRRTREAIDRKEEMERLYALSRAILQTESHEPPGKQIAEQIVRTFHLPGVALDDHSRGEIHSAGSQNLADLEQVLRKGPEGHLPVGPAAPIVVSPVRLGGEEIGALALSGSTLSETALQSVSNLVAIGLDRARAQQVTARAEAARQSQELKSTLMDALAHEFKTPLTSIKAAATALLSEAAPKLPTHRELLAIIDEDADRLARLVTEAIQMARIEGGTLQLNRGLHDPAALISATLRDMKHLTEGRRVEVQVPENLPPVFVDAGLVQLALRQVIDNALKFSSPAGSLTIAARSEADHLVISVADEGPGIPEREHGRVFEKFYRSPGHYRVAGTGMGLTVAREVLRAHGGDIAVKNLPGRGSEFSLVLALAPPENL
jgi:two-component system, OmpR family, sensor histidine kinase KdpD